jgi:hypothetical protein
MKQQSKLTAKQEQSVEQHSDAKAAHEFKNSDELLRFDAEKIVVPPEIAERLQKSAAHLAPPPPRPWWKNIFGG